MLQYPGKQRTGRRLEGIIAAEGEIRYILAAFKIPSAGWKWH
jgi:hypothetical protein